MKIVFLMGGETSSEESYPLYMAEMNDEIILERQIRYFDDLKPQSLLFCVKQEDVKKYNAQAVIAQSSDKAICIEINGTTAGSVCTALLAAEHIDNNEEVVLVAVDEMIDSPLQPIVDYFRAQQCDAGVVAFKSVHPRYSFAAADAHAQVYEVAEKRPISKDALASFYYFKHGRDFVACAQDVIRKDNRTNGAFYISQTMNEMILRQKKVGLHRISNQQFHPLKTKMQFAQYMLEIKEQRESH